MTTVGVIIFLTTVWAFGACVTLALSRVTYGEYTIPSDEKYRRQAARLWVFAPFWPVLVAIWFIRTTIWAFKNF